MTARILAWSECFASISFILALCPTYHAFLQDLLPSTFRVGTTKTQNKDSDSDSSDSGSDMEVGRR